MGCAGFACGSAVGLLKPMIGVVKATCEHTSFCRRAARAQADAYQTPRHGSLYSPTCIDVQLFRPGVCALSVAGHLLQALLHLPLRWVAELRLLLGPEVFPPCHPRCLVWSTRRGERSPKSRTHLGSPPGGGLEARIRILFPCGTSTFGELRSFKTRDLHTFLGSLSIEVLQRRLKALCFFDSTKTVRKNESRL